MPTKRRFVGRGAVPLGDVSLELIDVLLTGTSAADDFLRFDYSDAQLRALFVEHEAALRKEAARRGLTGEPWAATLGDGQRVHVDDGLRAEGDVEPDRSEGSQMTNAIERRCACGRPLGHDEATCGLCDGTPAATAEATHERATAATRDNRTITKDGD